MRRILLVLVPLISVGLATAACGSSGGSAGGAPAGASTSTAPATGNTIAIKNFAFSPATLTVSPGSTVTVRNEDSTTHTVTASDKSFDTGNITSAGMKTFTAPGKPGSYPYICTIHQFMQGTLIVR